MTYEARGRREPGNGLSLTVETVNKPDNIVEVQATVLFRKKHAPDPPQNVIFQLDGEDYAPEPTDEYGRVLVPIPLPGPGNYRLVVFLEDEPGIRRFKILTIEKPPAKGTPKAEKISVRVIGKSGEQKLFIYAVDKDGGLAPGIKGIILDGNKPIEFVTDANGMFVYQTNFTGDRVFRVRIGENENGETGNKERAWKGVLCGK